VFVDHKALEESGQGARGGGREGPARNQGATVEDAGRIGGAWRSPEGQEGQVGACLTWKDSSKILKGL
jgi:hypothetical protein